MAYTGVIIAYDLAGNTGVAEACPGQKPVFSKPELHKEGDELREIYARGLKDVATRLSAPRAIGNRIYASGEAIADGMVRVVIEAPIQNPMIGNTNARAQLITKGLWACVGGFAEGRGAMVRDVTVGKWRKHFIGSGRETGGEGKRKASRMCEALGWKPPSLDCADAAGVWHWASYLWNPEMTPPVAALQREFGWR